MVQRDAYTEAPVVIRMYSATMYVYTYIANYSIYVYVGITLNVRDSHSCVQRGAR